MSDEWGGSYGLLSIAVPLLLSDTLQANLIDQKAVNRVGTPPQQHALPWGEEQTRAERASDASGNGCRTHQGG